MIPQVRKRGGLWVTGHGYLVQSHASWREAAESLGAVRRFRQQVKNREASHRAASPKSSGTVTNRCGYNECRKLSSYESQLGLCDRHDNIAKEYLLTSHRATPRPQKKGFNYA